MKPLSLFFFSLILISVTSCGGGNSSNDDSNEQPSDTSNTANFKVTFTTHWSATKFSTQHPSSAHFSPLVGTVHNEQVVFWESNGQPATAGIKSMAETGSTTVFSNEINVAKDSGYSQGVINGGGTSGVDQITVEFDTNATYPLLTLVSMIAPSPDWFVGIHSVSLMGSNGEWIDRQEIKLKAYDAGTDIGRTFTSGDSDSSAQNLPITLLNSDRADSDFSMGVHFDTSETIGTLIIEQVEP